MWLIELVFPQSCKSDISKYGYLEVFQSPLEFGITRVDCIWRTHRDPLHRLLCVMHECFCVESSFVDGYFLYFYILPWNKSVIITAIMIKYVYRNHDLNTYWLIQNIAKKLSFGNNNTTHQTQVYKIWFDWIYLTREETKYCVNHDPHAPPSSIPAN